MKNSGIVENRNLEFRLTDCPFATYCRNLCSAWYVGSPRVYTLDRSIVLDLLASIIARASTRFPARRGKNADFCILRVR